MSNILKETFLRESQIKQSSSKFAWSKTYQDQNFGETKVKEIIDEDTIASGLGNIFIYNYGLYLNLGNFGLHAGGTNYAYLSLTLNNLELNTLNVRNNKSRGCKNTNIFNKSMSQKTI